MIDKFRGKYRFLSNFYPCDVEYKGYIFPSSENAYQAAKAIFVNEAPEDFSIFLTCTPAASKTYGRGVPMKGMEAFCDLNKIQIMKEIVGYKFLRNTYLLQSLLDTGSEELIEGNHWGDTFWGVCNGVGENHLGVILMELRENIKVME